jgi:hypothetical protein
MKTGLMEQLNTARFSKYLKILKQNKAYAYGLGIVLFLVVLISIYSLRSNTPMIWQPVPEQLLFALQYDNANKSLPLETQLTRLIPANSFNQWAELIGITGINENYQPKEILVAWHTATGNSLDQLFIWRFDEQVLDSLHQLINENKVDVKPRQYRGEKIFSASLNETVFSFYNYKNVLVGSYSSLLLEASIRQISEGNSMAKGFAFPTTQPEHVLLLANLPAFKSWLPSLFDEFPLSVNTIDNRKFAPIVLQFQLNGDNLKSRGDLRGKVDGTPNSGLNGFDVPAEVLFLSKQSIESGINEASILQRRALLKERFGFEAAKLLASVETELIQFILTRKDFYQSGKLIGITLKDSIMAAQQLALLNPEGQVNNNGFTRIRQPEFPSLLFPNALRSYTATFYQIKNGKLWLGNFEPNSTQIDRLSEIATQSGNKLFLRGSELFPYLTADISDSYVDDFSKVLENIAQGFYAKNDNAVYAEIILKGAEKQQYKIDTLFEVGLPQQVKQKVYQVKNHDTQATEFLWQDAKSRLALLSDTGTILWRKAVWQYAVSDIYQADIYNNQKLQYVFASEGRIHAYDRLGRTVNGFPMALPTYFEAQHVYPFRWQNEKEQRFLVGGSVPGGKDAAGGILYLYNRYGGLSRGWAPRKLEAPFACAPELVNHQGKDLMLVLLRNGSFYALDKSGRVQPGFPLITNMTCSQPFVVANKAGGKAATFMSEGGTLITVSLNGKLVKRESVISRASITTFTLVANKQQLGDYVIGMQQGNNLSIKDPNLQDLFTYESKNDDTKQLAYYDFGYGKAVFLVFSPKNKSVILLNKQGEKILEESIFTEIMPVVNFDTSTQTYSALVASKSKMRLIEWKD